VPPAHTLLRSDVRACSNGRNFAAVFLILGVLLVLAWLLGLVVLKVASLLIHLLLLFATLFGVFHFMRR
jgi:hypothetical protein